MALTGKNRPTGNRVCPHCGNATQRGESRIVAVFNGFAPDGAYIGGCGCLVCGGKWTELAYENYVEVRPFEDVK